MNKKQILLTASLASGIAFTPQYAAAALVPIEPWGIDLSGLNGTTQGATTYDNLSSLTVLKDIVLSGESSVIQNLGAGGDPTGLTFNDSGFLNWTGANNSPSGAVSAGAFAAFLGDNDITGDNFVYFEFKNLSGIATNNLGDISFDTGGAQLGTVDLYLDDEAQTLADVTGMVADATRLLLASFDVIDVSGGSGIATDGGAFPSGTIGITLDPTSLLAGVEFLDGLNNVIDEDVLFNFVDVDATLPAGATTFFAGPDATGAVLPGPAGAQSFLSEPISNDGSLVPAEEVVPEPNSLALLGIAILGLTMTTRKKRRA